MLFRSTEMFYETFSGCSGLTGIAPDVFGNISGTLKAHMFYGTFLNCSGLRGESAKINGKYLYEIWPKGGGNATYRNSTGLSDYATMPSVWK